MVLDKLVRIARSPNPVAKINEVLIRTPARHLLKSGANVVFANEKRRRTEAFNAMKLEVSEVAHVDELNNNGYTVLTGELDQGLLNEMDAMAADKRARRESMPQLASKKKWIRLLDEDIFAGKLDQNHAYVRFALQDKVMKIVSAYMGQVPYMANVLLLNSIGSNDPWEISQLWHQDRDDSRIVKLFIYFTDVEDDGQGPFTFLPKQPSAKIPTQMVMHHYPDEWVEKYVAKSEVKKMKAKKFAVFMVDTNFCWHMGGRVTEGMERLLYTATFISYPPIVPDWKNNIAVTAPLDPTRQLFLRTSKDTASAAQGKL